MIVRVLIAGLGAAVGLALLGWALSFTTATEPIEVPKPQIEDAGLSCSVLKREIRGLLASARACNSDEDCVFVGLGCPFGCRQAINRDHRTSILSHAVLYQKSTCSNCENICAPQIGESLCDQGQCRMVPLPEKPILPEG